MFNQIRGCRSVADDQAIYVVTAPARPNRHSSSPSELRTGRIVTATGIADRVLHLRYPNGILGTTGPISDDFVVRTSTAKCKSCGSSDLWRVYERSGIVAGIMRFRGRKPFQCRACGWICYRPARRATDNPQPFLRCDRALDSAANILTLSGVVGCAARQDDGVNEPLSRLDQGQRLLHS